MTGVASSRGLTIAAVAGGAIVGLAYTLSPLTVWFAVAAVWLVRVAVKDLDGAERRWIVALLVAAIALRVVAVAGLFIVTDHARVPFGSFFGDEEYFIRRSIWLRNVAFQIPIHRADLIYAFDDYSYTIYLYVLSAVQALVGPAPYGAHLFGCAVYLASAVTLYRTVRPRFGRVSAAIGLALLLFLPSLFAWSISVLKEPVYFLLAALSVWLIDRSGRAANWSTRIVAAIAVVAIAIALQSIREGGLAMIIAGVCGGVVLTFVLRRPRLAVMAALLMPAVVVAAAATPAVQVRADHAIREFARIHVGHITTPGYTYKLLDSRLYEPNMPIQSITVPEETRFLVRALVAYVAQPTPWSIQSRSALAYLPEQVIWYVMVLLIPVGLCVAARRDVLLTSVLAMYAVAAALMVALTGGNIGTLVRHRGLALPYIVWFAGLGASKCIARTRLHDHS